MPKSFKLDRYSCNDKSVIEKSSDKLCSHCKINIVKSDRYHWCYDCFWIWSNGDMKGTDLYDKKHNSKTLGEWKKKKHQQYLEKNKLPDFCLISDSDED